MQQIYKSNLEIIYSSPNDQYDLDSITTFLGESVGYGFGSIKPYIQYFGFETENKPERVVIDLQKAYLDNLISGNLSINCYADWYPPESGSGTAIITWGYGGNSFSEIIYPNSVDHSGERTGTLVKIIDIETGASDIYPYVSPYSQNNIYEFEPIFNLNTGDLSIITTGYAVHGRKDVSFVLNITDRQLNTLTSTSALLENPFVKAINIDILSIYGNTVYDNYVTGSFENIFTLTEQQNIDIFGFYNQNFGIGISTVGENANIHSSRYYVYSNPLEIQSISVDDSSGVWLNNNPVQYQSYIPYSTSGGIMNVQNVKNNALYINEYKDYISGYFVEISGLIPFAILSGESLKIDWGSGQIDTIFNQTGESGFQSISGVTSFNTNTGDALLLSLINPTGIDGQTYSFVTGYNYPVEVTGIYDVKLYYSGIGSTGDELVKTVQYRIPDELKDQGKPQIGDPVSGQINFNIEFENNPLYTNSDKLSLYLSTGSGVEVSSGNFVSTIPILTNLKNYSFNLNNSVVKTNTPQWFKIIPSSEIQTGYAWEIGPYNIYEPPTPKSNISSESFSLLNGESEATMDFLTGLVETNSITTIDTLIKGQKYSYEYFTQFKDQSECYCSSKIIIVDNTSGTDLSRTGLSFSEYSISDNSFANYSISGDDQNIYLNVQLDTPTGFYKLYKTSI